MNRFANPLIGSATADVAAHGVVDIGIGGRRLFGEQRRGRHDLSGLAVAALGYVDRRPRFLNGMRAGGRQALDGDDLVGGLHAADGERARAHQPAIDVHGAGSALRDSAAELRPGQPHLLADDPEQRRVGFDLYVPDLAIDVQLRHGFLPLGAVNK